MNNEVHNNSTLAVKLPTNVGTYEKIGANTWKWALLFAYFAMVVDGIDIMLLFSSLAYYRDCLLKTVNMILKNINLHVNALHKSLKYNVKSRVC